jgi:hypothetical protein
MPSVNYIMLIKAILFALVIGVFSSCQNCDNTKEKENADAQFK